MREDSFKLGDLSARRAAALFLQSGRAHAPEAARAAASGLLASLSAMQKTSQCATLASAPIGCRTWASQVRKLCATIMWVATAGIRVSFRGAA